MPRKKALIVDEWTRHHLPILQFIAAVDRVKYRAWGPDPTDAAIMVHAWLGYLEDRPWNRAGLATLLGVSLGTLRNHLSQLVERGWLLERPTANGYLIIPTEASKIHVKASGCDALIPALIASAKALELSLSLAEIDE